MSYSIRKRKKPAGWTPTGKQTLKSGKDSQFHQDTKRLTYAQASTIYQRFMGYQGGAYEETSIPKFIEHSPWIHPYPGMSFEEFVRVNSITLAQEIFR